MDIGIMGLGRMGANMARRLLGGGHRVVVANRSRGPVDELVSEGAFPGPDAAGLVAALAAPRTVWLMLPAGEATEQALEALAALMSPGDLLVDGGNAFYKDSQRRASWLAERGLLFMDAGVSGGVWGLEGGYSLMVGGSAEAVARVQPALETLAPAAYLGWGHVGPAGAGHFVKMVHNGIEYGMMQAYAEGFELLRARTDLRLDLHQVAEVWRYGSVVRSWLLDLIAAALEDDASLSGIKGWVADSGEGRWTVAEAVDMNVPAPVITLSLLMRFVSRQDESYSAKLLAAMRNQFGGHAVVPADSDAGTSSQELPR
jgi:6-phosphogluconate dehydrogenase